jgi:hypothetical protein
MLLRSSSKAINFWNNLKQIEGKNSYSILHVEEN